MDVGDVHQRAAFQVEEIVVRPTILDARYHLYYGTQPGHIIGLDTNGATPFDVDLGAPVDCYPALTADANLIIGARNGTLASIG